MHRVPIPFKSKLTRNPDIRFLETEEDVLVNNVFDLRFSLARAREKGKREKHLVIMVNGFAEMGDALYYDPDTGLAPLLARSGIASVLLPIPFHMNRTPRNETYEAEADRQAKRLRKGREEGWTQIPRYIVETQADRFYLGYRQFLSDIRHLATAIQNPSDRNHPNYRAEYEAWFDNETQIHILGYSLGGLGCFAALLRARGIGRDMSKEKEVAPENAGAIAPKEEPRISSCVLLCSGGTFLDMNPRVLRYDMERWEALRDYYYHRAFEERFTSARARKERIEEEIAASAHSGGSVVPSEDGDPVAPEDRLADAQADIDNISGIHTQSSLSYRLFERVVLGIPWDTKDAQEVIASTVRDVMVILGTKDSTISADTVLQLKPKQRDFCTLRIPVTHVLGNHDLWKKWADVAVSSITAFLTRPKHED